MQDLTGLTAEKLGNWLAENGWPAYRGRQIFGWVQKKSITSIDELANIPKDLQNWLKEKAFLNQPQTIKEMNSIKGDTIKFLLQYPDEVLIETVLMLYEAKENRARQTCCVSTQAGCGMGCLFCATGLGGLERNLTAGEIVAQVQKAQKWCLANGLGGVSNVVYMGMGEPLANLASVLESMKILNHPDGLNIGWRRFTVSTCGIVPQIYKLAQLSQPVELAISLHAADNDLRNRLMPINRQYCIEELLAACDVYAKTTGRRITYEYALFKGVNDSRYQAEALVQLLKGKLAHINIITGNPVSETGFISSSREVLQDFAAVLQKNGLKVTVRQSRGVDIDAACGQLRRQENKKAGGVIC